MKKYYKQKTNRSTVDLTWFSPRIMVNNSLFRSIRTFQEKKKWFSYIDQANEFGFNVRRRARSKSSLVDSWDDIHNSTYMFHKKSWKAHTKCRKQWEKNIN